MMWLAAVSFFMQAGSSQQGGALVPDLHLHTPVSRDSLLSLSFVVLSCGYCWALYSVFSVLSCLCPLTCVCSLTLWFHWDCVLTVALLVVWGFDLYVLVRWVLATYFFIFPSAPFIQRSVSWCLVVFAPVFFSFPLLVSGCCSRGFIRVSPSP